MAEALVAFGGNVGDARTTIARAIESFCSIPAVRLLARSSDYRTPPWGVTNQASFINACIEVQTGLAPIELLAHGHAIEQSFGRDRNNETRWGPRTLDIDLLDYSGTIVNGPSLTLPHPRLMQRAFVLVPLAEIAPGRIIAGMRVSEALSALDTTGIERLS